MNEMEIHSFTSVICMYCVLVCFVSGQQTGALPEEESKKSSDDSKFIPITRDSPKFSLGLGVLSPSYTQKFGDEGKTKLDFNQDSGGFSYSLNSLSHPMAKPTDRSGTDDKKYSTDTMKTAGDSHQLTPSSQYNPSSYSLSVGTGSRSDYSSVGNGYGSQGGSPPMPQSYGPGAYGQSYGQSYSPTPGFGPPGYAPMPYGGYPSSGPQYSQSGAYSPSAIAPGASNIQPSPAQSPYSPAPIASAPQPYASAPAPQTYAPVQQPQPQYSPYMGQMASPYGSYGQPMMSYGMSPYGSPQASPYGGYGSQYGGMGAGMSGGMGGGMGAGMGGGMGSGGMSAAAMGGGMGPGAMGGGYGGMGGMYGSPSTQSSSAYPYGGGSSDPLANLSPSDINTLRQLYGASSTTSPSYMSPYGGAMSGAGGGGYGGMGGGYGGMGGSSGGGGALSSLISMFG